jgi:hypothetical protein
MAFDLAAWALTIVVGYAVGNRTLTLLGANRLRAGDRVIIAIWIGVSIVALTLLGVSLFRPLSPATSAIVAAVLVAAALATRDTRVVTGGSRVPADAPIPVRALVAGIALAALGAAALASDPVTLYDSLVYHVGIIRWLREYGTVPGLALIHNRLGHVSAWFALGAAFDAGPFTDRATNVPLGLALVLVAGQAAVAVARIATRRACEADWFLALATAILISVGVADNAATPSPDVPANVLIVLVAWSMLVVPRTAHVERGGGWRRWLTPRVIPFVLAICASGMKLFALPAAVAAALFYILGRGEDADARDAVIRAAICGVVGLTLLAPFIAANVIASGCPLFPSPVACVATPWSIGASQAADYAEYIRDVARWESRRSMSGATQLPWGGTWIASHPVLTALSALAPLLAVVLMRGPRRDGVRSAALLAVLGIAFVGWHAPAPRFFFAFVIVVPVLAVVYPLSTLSRSALSQHRPEPSATRAALAFVTTTLVIGIGCAVASQKLNVVSAVTSGAAVVHGRSSDLLLPAAPQPPSRLYVWRVNDVDLVTPVPRPIADTLSYFSAIDANSGYEECSTAPLPCTPYLPSLDVRLRVPERGVSGGFVRDPDGITLTIDRVRCVGELRNPAPGNRLRSGLATPDATPSSGCEATDPR